MFPLTPNKKGGFALLRVFLLLLFVSAIVFFVSRNQNHSSSQRGDIKGSHATGETLRAVEYQSPDVIDPKALKALKVDYFYRGSVSSQESIDLMLNNMRDKIFDDKQMVHKRYIPHLNSEGDKKILQGIYNWATANDGNGGSKDDPVSDYAVCYNEQQTGYSVGWTNDYMDYRLGGCIDAIRHPFGKTASGEDDPRNTKWSKTKIIVSLGAPSEGLTTGAELSPWNDDPRYHWNTPYYTDSAGTHYIANSSVLYHGTVTTSPRDTRTAETAKLVDARFDAKNGGTYWQSEATSLPVSVEIPLNIDSMALPRQNPVSRVRFYPKLPQGTQTGKIVVEIWATDVNTGQQLLAATVDQTVSDGDTVEQVFKPAIFEGTKNDVSTIKLIAKEWPGNKVGYYEITADVKANPDPDLNWAVIGLFPKWPNIVANALKAHKDDIYGFALHYYPGYICRGFSDEHKKVEALYGWKNDDRSYTECTRDYIHDAKQFLLENGLSDKSLSITEWGSSQWAEPGATIDKSKPSWKDPYRWFQFWNMLESENIDFLSIYSPIWIRDWSGLTPSVQCQSQNQNWSCQTGHPDYLGCHVAPGGLVFACDPVHPLTPSETLHDYGKAFASLADINSGQLPQPPTVKNGTFENGLNQWRLCGDKNTSVTQGSQSKTGFSYVRDVTKKNPIANNKSLTIAANESSDKQSLQVGICQDTIWPKVDLFVRYLAQSPNNARNGFIISADDGAGVVRVGFNLAGNLNSYTYDLQQVLKIKIKKNLTKKSTLSINFAELYFKKFNRGILPKYTLSIQAVAANGSVELQLDNVFTKDYKQQISSVASTAQTASTLNSIEFLDED